MLGEKYACEIPEVLKKFTLVTKGDAAIGAHSMYVSNLSETDIDPDTSASKTFDGHVWGGYIPPREERLEDGSIIYLRNMTFNGDTTENVGLADAGIDWAHIEWLAQNLEDW
ncbi:unnamed protein product [Cylindrotheca closterium]|uniref:Uncharacterized protein n=1 Tax=Cylindrotheca closterium TaxID=2856 RepID=A0AAD2JLE5_9STRA|nr:unnamed protein product [Cylindrotheca closterium]